MRGSALRNTERWGGRRAPTQDPGTNRLPSRAGVFHSATLGLARLRQNTRRWLVSHARGANGLSCSAHAALDRMLSESGCFCASPSVFMGARPGAGPWPGRSHGAAHRAIQPLLAARYATKYRNWLTTRPSAGALPGRVLCRPDVPTRVERKGSVVFRSLAQLGPPGHS